VAASAGGSSSSSAMVQSAGCNSNAGPAVGCGVLWRRWRRNIFLAVLRSWAPAASLHNATHTLRCVCPTCSVHTALFSALTRQLRHWGCTAAAEIVRAACRAPRTRRMRCRPGAWAIWASNASAPSRLLPASCGCPRNLWLVPCVGARTPAPPPCHAHQDAATARRSPSCSLPAVSAASG
jgi:hypothetical protein